MSERTQKFTAVKGMVDILPPASRLWQKVEDAARQVFGRYGYQEIRTPIVELTELFNRGVGAATAIVEKEMYTFEDRSGDLLSLRPEGTASVVRAYIESGACLSEPLARYYYMGPMFRRERPQKGRQRQFYQIGCELFGVTSPVADAEVMAMISNFMAEVRITDVALEINSLGCPECRPSFNNALLSFLKKCESKLCEDCARRIQRNPMRALDCKNENCIAITKNAPAISEFWCAACRAHFDEVKRALAAMGADYKENLRIVRGLDYYMRTAFEFTTTKLGAQNAVAAGGRYDGLVKSLGGPDVPGVGIALGMERLILLIEQIGAQLPVEDIIFFAVLGDKARTETMPLIETLRKDGVRVEWDFGERSLKAQMRRAGKISAKTVVIIGDNEIAKGAATVKDMHTSSQREVRIADLPRHFVNVGSD